MPPRAGRPRRSRSVGRRRSRSSERRTDSHSARLFGTRILRPIVGEFLEAYPAVQIRYLLLNRLTNLVDEGIDVALRISALPDSALIAQRIGEVRRVLCASPQYLARHPAPKMLSDLADHNIIAIEPTNPEDIWSFPPAPGGKIARTVRVKPRLMVNADEAAVSAAIDGEGIVRIFSYKIQDEVRSGQLRSIGQTISEQYQSRT